MSPSAQSHAAKRILQTPKAFSNWVPVLADLAREKVGRGPDTLTFHTRAGLRIDCPNQPGSRVPIYEIFAEDSYHFDWFLGSLAERPIQAMDIGGQIGTFSCRLAQVHPFATIATYEPSATSATFLRRNIEQNGFASSHHRRREGPRRHRRVRRVRGQRRRERPQPPRLQRRGHRDPQHDPRSRRRRSTRPWRPQGQPSTW